ncbi:hypothetical protein LSCM1_06161 [Leishmania martiniquensis]|uniref:Palmitoyltransferase n=1 Tax=Leishmania martiniquensis TaxID=1580590 RepID=A0A836H3C4_9TRYP|nr:hypothetical protein LSCM1_06161 [Leishmania martiniquensis]
MSDNHYQQQRRYKDGDDDAIAADCRCLNVVAHPEPTKGCHERCMMCCGYCTPTVIALLIVALAVASDVYSFLLIARNSRDAWRIVVCVVVLLLTTSMCLLVLWSFYAIVFSSPGFVPQDPWAYPPLYAGPSADSSSGGERVFVQSSHDSTVRQPLLSQQQQQQHQGVVLLRQPGSPGLLVGQSPRAPSLNQAPTANHVLVTVAAGGSAFRNPLHLGPQATSPGSASVSEANGRPYAAPIHADENGASHLGDSRDADTIRVTEISNSQCHSPYPPPSEHELRIGPTFESMVAVTPSAGQEQHHLSSPTWPNKYTVTTLGRDGCLRFCDVCHVYKPDGAHHCRTCRRCVYNFDHHCPFLNNCVGRNNYKLFIVFLLYSGIGAVLDAGLMAVLIFAVDRDPIMKKAGWAVIPGLDLILGFSLLLFYAQHRVLLSKGQSTLESLTSGGGDGLEAFCDSCRRPRLTPEQKVENKRRLKEKVQRHKRTLLGKESSVLRMYLPLPVRTDNTADETVPMSV